MVMPQVLRASIRKPNSVGLVPATGGNDLVHLLGTNRSGVTRTAIIRKILAYNNTGANVTLQLGTRDFSAVPLFVQYLPDLLALNGLDSVWEDGEIPAVEFSLLTLPLALGREGNIYLLASAAGVLVTLEADELGS